MHAYHWGDVDPDRPAIIMGGSGEVTTYGELAARSRRLARHLREVGLARGDHLAVVLENHPAFFEVVWAGLLSGLYVTPVNRHLTPDEVAYIVGDSDAKAVVSSGALAGTVSAIDWDRLPQVRARLMIGGGEGGFDDYESIVGSIDPAPQVEPSSGAFMFYTSGMTGRPKGVLRPLPDRRPDELDPYAEALGALLGIGEDSTYLSPAPLYHAAPLAYTVMVQRLGGTVVMMERFDAKDALRLIEAHGVTHSQWVPTMFIRMLGLAEEERRAYDLSTHRVAVHAAAPCPPEVKRRMIEWWGPMLVEYYAGTETAGRTIINSSEWLEHPGSVGRGNVRIIDERGVELPPGEVGTVYFVGGPEFEYKGDPDKTASMRLPGGLTTMGDCGYLDEEGWLYLTDRKDFMIISGGVNIYPREAEDVLIGHPAVLDVAVFGVPDADLGEAAKAAVQLKPDVAPSDVLSEDILAFCRSRLAAYKCPRSVDFVAELPRTPTGKLLKRLLRDRHSAAPATG